MRDEIRTLLATIMPPEQLSELSDGDSLSERGLLDSMGFFSLVSQIENIYGVTIDTDEITLENFDSVDAILNFIGEKQKQGA